MPRKRVTFPVCRKLLLAPKSHALGSRSFRNFWMRHARAENVWDRLTHAPADAVMSVARCLDRSAMPQFALGFFVRRAQYFPEGRRYWTAANSRPRAPDEIAQRCGMVAAKADSDTNLSPLIAGSLPGSSPFPKVCIQ